MKGKIFIEFSAKEAVEMLSNPGTSRSLQRKIVKAFQAAPVTPVGAKNSVVARTKAATTPNKAATKKVASPRATARPGEATEQTGNSAHS